MRTIKLILPLLAIFLITKSIQAQDLIVTKSNDTISCRIVAVDKDQIQYEIMKGSVLETHYVARTNVAEFVIAPLDNTTTKTATNTQTTQTTSDEYYENRSSFRIAFAGGFAYKLGDFEGTGNSKLDRISRNLLSGLGLEFEIDYYFINDMGIGINVNYFNTSASAKNINIPNYGPVYNYSETHHILFVGPSYVIRYDTPRWLFTANVGIGPIFLINDIVTDAYNWRETATSVGMNYGLGAEYKFSNNLAAGLRLSTTTGTYSSSTINGRKVKYDEAYSLSNMLLSAYISFRSK